jgi:hypothetical protein
MHLKVIQQMAQIPRSDEMDGCINPDSILSAGAG